MIFTEQTQNSEKEQSEDSEKGKVSAPEPKRRERVQSLDIQHGTSPWWPNTEISRRRSLKRGPRADTEEGRCNSLDKRSEDVCFLPKFCFRAAPHLFMTLR